MEKHIRYIVGIDEAGRGPLAGPVTVGMVCIPISFNPSLLRGVRDSKKISHSVRERWFEKAGVWQKQGLLRYKVTHVGSSIIDRDGISSALREGIQRVLKDIDPICTHIYLDGSLYAPSKYTSQETIVRGDDRIPLISLASICAKVSRDKKMERYSHTYPDYGFERNKGYGTQAHRRVLKKHGYTDIHRTSWNI